MNTGLIIFRVVSRRGHDAWAPKGGDSSQTTVFGLIIIITATASGDSRRMQDNEEVYMSEGMIHPGRYITVVDLSFKSRLMVVVDTT